MPLSGHPHSRELVERDCRGCRLLRTPGCRMYRREDDSPRKPCLVLACGHMCGPGQWHHQIDDLSDVLDIVVADLTLDDTIAAMAERLLDMAPPHFSLAGFSLGGFVAFEVMRTAAERVDRLVLIDTSARPDSAERAARRKQEIARAENGEFESLLEPWIPTLVSDNHPERPTLLKTIKNDAEEIGPVAYLRQQRAMLLRPDSRDGLRNIKCPTLVVCGQDDRLTPVELHVELAAAIPHSKLSILEGAGHVTTIEQPEVVSALLRSWIALDTATRPYTV